MRDSNLNGDGSRLSLAKLDNAIPNDVRECATLYAGIGLSIVPNQRGRKRPTVKGWPELRISSDEISDYFEEGQNIGLLMGESSGGLVDVDLDCREARAVADRFLPDTLTSGRKNAPRSHRFVISPGAKSKSWRLPGEEGKTIIELRSTGTQTLVEPSIHPTGERYEWDRDGVLEAVEISAEQLEVLCSKIATAAVTARRLPTGGRHHFALALAGYLLQPGRLDEETTRDILLAAWHAAGTDSREALDDVERIVRDTTKKIASGKAVVGGPALEELVPGLPKLFARWRAWGEGEQVEDSNAASGKGAPTDDEVRDRFYGANPHHAYGLGEWKHYESGVWSPVPEFIVKRRIVAELEAAKPEGVRPTSGRLSSVHELARVDSAIEDERWDSDPDILVCANGVVHIPTGELLPHSPEHYATGAVPYDYDPAAQAPTWERVLDDILGIDLARFFQEFAGYSATPDTSLETAMWFCGQPGGGRSTLLAGLETMLGPRVGVLGLGEIERNRFALAQIPGKFLLTATEQPAGYMKVSHVLNGLISGEPLQIERKYLDPFTLVPRCKIAWAMNEMPRLKSASDGLFRRVKVIELDPIPEKERDPEIKEKIRGEGAGILNWALEGLGRLRERGHFEIPEVVRKATEEFRLTNDVARAFVDEACITSDADGCKEQAQDLYNAYRHWCLINGHKPMSTKSVAKEWKRLGFGSRPLHGRTVYIGVKVDPQWIAAQDFYPRNR